MIDTQSRQTLASNRSTKALVQGMKDSITSALKTGNPNEEVLKLVVKREEEQALLDKVGKIGDALAMVYRAVTKPLLLPKIFQVKGQVEVTRSAPIRITNLSELEKYFKSLEERLIMLAQAASNAPAPRVEIPKFPKIEIPKADNGKIESLLEDLVEKINNIQPQEVRFPKTIDIGNFPRQMIPQPVTHISINSLNGFIKTTAATVTTVLTPLPTYGVLANRKSMIVYNNGSNTVFIGGSDVTSSNGLPVPTNTYSPPLDNGVNTLLYGVTSSSSSDVRVMEISDEGSGR